MDRPGRLQSILFPGAMFALGMSFGLIPLLQGRLFFYNDNPIEYYAHAEFLARALSHGAIPQWWENVGFGLPVIAEGEAHYTPIRILLAATLSAPAAFMTEIGVCFGLVGLGTYLFLRRIGLHPLVSSAGAIAFMFGSQFVVYVEDMGLLRAACFLPWILWLAESSFDPKKSRMVLWSGPPIIALQFLSGNPTFAVVTIVALFCYLAARSVTLSIKTERTWLTASRDILRVVLGWGLIVALGFAMAAVQIIPTFRHIPESVRAGGLSLEYAANTSHTRLKDFVQLFFPYLSDVRNVVTAMAGFYDGGLIAVAALFLLWRIRRAGAPAVCLVLSGMLGALISLGSSTPLYGLLFRLPLFNGLRFPVRYQFWTSFCFACLGAIGLQQAIDLNKIAGRTIGRLRVLFPVAASLLTGAAAAWWLRPGRAAEFELSVFFLTVSFVLFAGLCISRGAWPAVLPIAVLFLLADLSYFRFHSNYAPGIPIANALKLDGVAEWLHRDPDHFRIFSLFDSQEVEPKGLRHQDALMGSSPGIWDLNSLGYHGSLELRRYERVVNDLISDLLSHPDHAPRFASFLAFTQTKYVIAPAGHELQGWEPVLQQGGATVWKNPAFRPGVVLVGQLQQEEAGSDSVIVEQIRSAATDFRRTAVIASDQLPELSGPGNRADVRPLAHGYDELSFQVSSAGRALLVIPSNYYPGWTATVNGHPAQIYRTNWIGTGVLVDAGDSVVRLAFSAPGFQTGIAVSVLASAVWILLAILWCARLRKNTSAQPSGVGVNTSSRSFA